MTVDVLGKGRNGGVRGEAPLGIRAHPLVFGVVIFLASELMFFAGLFAAYFDLRSTTAVWPPPDVHLDLVSSSFGTFLLFASSFAMILMSRALDRRRFRAAHGWLGTGIVCAAAFIGISLHGYAKNTFTIAGSAYGSLYYAMTGFHLLHVTAGIVLLAGLFLALRSRTIDANQRAAAEAISYYWHFVFVVWAGIWSAIYLIR